MVKVGGRVRVRFTLDGDAHEGEGTIVGLPTHISPFYNVRLDRGDAVRLREWELVETCAVHERSGVY